MSQAETDAQNSVFWNELCGSGLARQIGITDHSMASLEKFDRAYMEMYPYLLPYVTSQPMEGRKVLEIGLGYGTLGQCLVNQRCRYHGLDISPGPVKMMQQRLRLGGLSSANTTLQGSALAIPLASGSFDYVYSIGCLHHTGDTPRAIQEVHRVLKEGGKAILMLYNKNSLRQWVIRVKQTLQSSFDSNKVRWQYDHNAQGDAAPHTDFFSRSDVQRMCASFRDVRIQPENMDTYAFLNGRCIIRRESLLETMGKWVGLDLYITLTK